MAPYTPSLADPSDQEEHMTNGNSRLSPPQQPESQDTRDPNRNPAYQEWLRGHGDALYREWLKQNGATESRQEKDPTPAIKEHSETTEGRNDYSYDGANDDGYAEDHGVQDDERQQDELDEEGNEYTSNEDNESYEPTGQSHPRGRKSGETDHVDGKLVWRMKEDDNWEFAVLHKNIREDLLKWAARQGKYRHKHARGEGNSDRTAFFAPHRKMSENRDERPEILFKYTIDGHYGPRNDPDVWRWEGQVVLSEDYWPILDWNIPVTISSQEKGWYLEILHRENTRLRPYDILQRMPSNAWKGKKLGNCLAMRRARFRLEAGLKAWSNRSKNTAAMDMLDQIVGPVCIRKNSTKYKGRDLNPEEIARYKSVGKGKNPERIRNNKPYKAELVKIKKEKEVEKALLKNKKNTNDSDSDDWEGFEENESPTPSAPSRQYNLPTYPPRAHPGTMNPLDPHSPRRPSPIPSAGSAGSFARKRQSLSRHVSRREVDYKKRRVVSAPEQRDDPMIGGSDQFHQGPSLDFDNQFPPMQGPNEQSFPADSILNQFFTDNEFGAIPDGPSYDTTTNVNDSGFTHQGFSHHTQPHQTPNTSFNDSSMQNNSDPFNPSPQALSQSRRVVSAPQSYLHPAPKPHPAPPPYQPTAPPTPLRDYTLVPPRTQVEKNTIASLIRGASQDFRHITGYEPRPTDANQSYHVQMEDLEQQLFVLRSRGMIRSEAIVDRLTRARAWLGGFPGASGAMM